MFEKGKDVKTNFLEMKEKLKNVSVPTWLGYKFIERSVKDKL